MAIVSSAAMNTGVHVSFQLEFLSYLDICPGVGLLDHVVALFLVFKGTSILLSIVAAPIYIPTNSVGGFPSPQDIALLKQQDALHKGRPENRTP